jgi:hypothetical protein
VSAGKFPASLDNELSDISVTADGKVRVVWQVEQADLNVYAYTFKLPVGDFNLSAISPMTISAGGSGSTNVMVNPASPRLISHSNQARANVQVRLTRANQKERARVVVPELLCSVLTAALLWPEEYNRGRQD